ncbi:hypothetical protein NFI96_006387 [Prochilodus magdalenae]|nr:hypothetical protein NFI96_006387 [Prochilodus magdalenae]
MLSLLECFIEGVGRLHYVLQDSSWRAENHGKGKKTDPLGGHGITGIRKSVCVLDEEGSVASRAERHVCPRLSSEVQIRSGEAVKHGGGSIMVWGCMSAAVCGELQFIEGTMNANMYCDMLKQRISPSLRKLGDRAIFQYDNDTKHTSKIKTTAFLKKLRVKVLDWPRMTPDLNSNEHLWGIPKRKVKEYKVSCIH